MGYRFVDFGGYDLFISLLSTPVTLANPVPGLIVSTLTAVKASGETLCLIIVLPNLSVICPFNPAPLVLPDIGGDFIRDSIELALQFSSNNFSVPRDIVIYGFEGDFPNMVRTDFRVSVGREITRCPKCHLLTHEALIPGVLGFYDTPLGGIRHSLALLDSIYESGHFTLRPNNIVVMADPYLFFDSRGLFKRVFYPRMPGASAYGPGFGPVPINVPAPAPAPRFILGNGTGVCLPFIYRDFDLCVANVVGRLTKEEYALCVSSVASGDLIEPFTANEYVRALEKIRGKKLTLIEKLKLIPLVST